MNRPAALVTGASSGIGLSFAQHLARTGHDLILVARREDRLRSLADELTGEHGIAVEVLVADLADPDDLDLVEARLQHGEPVDLFVNNAGFAAMGKVGEGDREDMTDMLLLNVVAFSRLADAAMAGMKRHGRGTIINVGSGTLFTKLPGYAGYGASKAYVAYYTRVMQVEAKDSGIRVQLLIPGVTATDFHHVAGKSIDDFPPERVMEADDLVVASLRGLELGEAVCIPSLPDVADWAALEAAEAKIAPNASRDRVAERYHG
ncbi:SDR family NAD(P)-dependent oxidoreductase [Sphingomonas silueang]|uniref:SDR family NAD(P)-dependent oxidoreductase n=1 Tax=Sphingomonas silueang TaxID=3156617 RepID=UPI0032B4DC9D